MKNIESKLIEVRSYNPPAIFSNNANLKKTDLDLLKKEFEDNPDLFWSKLARNEISWIKDFKSVCTGHAPFFEWFKEGKLNVSQNCLDRHIDTNKKNKPAIVHISEDNKKVTLTYNELFNKVNSFSNALIQSSMVKGDRVIIYMPTTVSYTHLTLPTKA